MIKSEVKAPVEMFVCVVVNGDGRSNGDETWKRKGHGGDIKQK